MPFKVQEIRFSKDIKIENINQIADLLFFQRTKTYYLNEGIHCNSYKFRSPGDFYNLCIHYFPDVKNLSYTSILNLLKEIRHSTYHDVKFMICPDIRKHTWRFHTFPKLSQFNELHDKIIDKLDRKKIKHNMKKLNSIN